MGLDLEEGDEELANATPAERRRAARKAATEGKETATKTPSRARAAVSDRAEAELVSRVSRTLDRIVKVLEAREDDELANIITEDRDAMSQGLVSLTKSIKILRSPFLIALNLVEPTLAFGRVGRVLYVRFMERQQRRAWERQNSDREEVPSYPVAATP